MNKRFLATTGIGLGLIAIAVAIIFYVQRGAHIELKGAILKVRTVAMDERSSVAVVDFRIFNPSDYNFIVRSVNVSVQRSDGQTYPGSNVSDVDAKRLFQYFPLLGQKFNDSLVMRDKIGSRVTEDRMIAARFEIPLAQLDARKQLTVRIEDVDGPVSELVEKR